ncbi:MAG: peptide ABC transporter substrate-binding protein, partial [Chloroflexota bacterium]|nr:peptide ABC transporter substrate-binding protein [Chloroflexota bacterium]
PLNVSYEREVSALGSDGTPSSSQSITIIARDEPSLATPSGDQTLRLAGPVQGFDSLDPAVARDVTTVFLVRQVFRGLTRFDRELTPVPELAEQIAISADGLLYTFVLRADARFHNGQSIQATDVAFSFSRALDPETAGGQVALLGAPTYLSDIVGAADVMRDASDTLAGVRALDERTVEIRLTRPSATFLMKLASAPASIISQTDVLQGGDQWRQPVGSGPFQVEEWTAEERLVLTRFEGYTAEEATLERVEIMLGPGASQSFNLYQQHVIDIDTVPVESIDRVLDPSSGIAAEVETTPLFGVHYVAFRTDVAPMDDPNIRRALWLGFPRAKVADVTYGGHVRRAEGLIPTGMLGRSWPVDTPIFDPVAAQEAISASRYGTADRVPPIRIYTAGGGPSESMRDAVRASIGLEIEIVSVNFPEFIDGLALRRYSGYEINWFADYPDPESLLWMLFGSESADNYIEYTNPTFDELLREANAELDVSRRSAIYAEAHQLLLNDGVVIPFYYDVAYTLRKPYVFGLEVTPQGLMRLESVWLER